MADINLLKGGGKASTFLLRDQTNNLSVPANYANLTFNNSNPGAATFEADSSSPDPESKVKVVALAVGSGVIGISVDVTYVDPGDGIQRTETKTLSKTFEVTGTPHGVNLELIFP